MIWLSSEQFFKNLGDNIKAQRIKERVEYDMEMIKELGHCSGIENYSRYFDGRHEGERPYCLLDFFPKDFLLVVTRVMLSIPQIGSHVLVATAPASKTWWNMVSVCQQPSTTVRYLR